MWGGSGFSKEYSGEIRIQVDPTLSNKPRRTRTYLISSFSKSGIVKQFTYIPKKLPPAKLYFGSVELCIIHGFEGRYTTQKSVAVQTNGR